MKKSILAKILILVMCLSLLLCACGKDNSGNKNDPTDAPTSAPTDPTSGNPDGPEDPSDPSAPGDDIPGFDLGSILEGIFGEDVNPDDLKDALQCGKVTLTVGDMLTNVMYVDAANLKFVDHLNMNVEGTEVNAKLYLDQHDLVIALPEMLDGAYGVSFDTLLTDLPTSAIWGMMGTTYDDFMGQLSDSLGGAMDAMDNLEGMLTGASECLESLSTALTEALENVKQTTTSGQVDIYGKTVDADIVSYDVDSAAMEKIVNILLDWCNDNAQDLADLLDSEELTAQAIIDAITGAKTDVADFFDTADLKARLALNTNTSTGALMSIDGSFTGTIDGDEGGFYLNLTLGEDPAESDLYSFSILDNFDDGFSVTLGTKTEDTKTTVTLTASSIIAGDIEESIVVAASYNTADSKYNLTLNATDMAYAVNGTCKVTDSSFEFTVDTLVADGEETVLNLKLVAESINSTEIPNAPSYTNVLQMTEAELNDLLAKFMPEGE